MPKLSLTSKKILNDIKSGKIKSEEHTKVTFSLRYRELIKILEFREKTGKSVSSIIRDSVSKFIKAYNKENEIKTEDIDIFNKLLPQLQKKIAEEIRINIKSAIKEEGISESSESIAKYNSQIISLLKDVGPLKSNKLSKYLGISWETIQKLCSELKEVNRENGKWRLI